MNEELIKLVLIDGPDKWNIIIDSKTVEVTCKPGATPEDFRRIARILGSWVSINYPDEMPKHLLEAELNRIKAISSKCEECAEDIRYILKTAKNEITETSTFFHDVERYRILESKIKDYETKIAAQEKKIAEQERRIIGLVNTINDDGYEHGKDQYG